jgi:hypothetical protein
MSRESYERTIHRTVSFFERMLRQALPFNEDQQAVTHLPSTTAFGRNVCALQNAKGESTTIAFVAVVGTESATRIILKIEDWGESVPVYDPE